MPLFFLGILTHMEIKDLHVYIVLSHICGPIIEVRLITVTSEVVEAQMGAVDGVGVE